MMVLWSGRHVFSDSPNLPYHGGNHPNEPNYGCKQRVGHDVGVGSVSGYVQSKAAVDHAQGYDKSSNPDVQVRGYPAPTVFSEADVVQGAEDGLEEEQNEYNNSENGMIVMILQLW
jgi:hypothetical protein